MSKVISNSTTIFGRSYEIAELRRIGEEEEPSIIVVHGRRRAGKTFLIETVFKDRNLIKFEGLERQSEEKQRKHFLFQLSKHTKTFSLSKIKGDTWIDVFGALYDQVENGIFGKKPLTLFFEELQWMANYGTEMIAELKYAWDNQFQKVPKLKLVLCGSSPSFMINKVMRSKSLYNRSQYELPIEPFTLKETQEFLGKRYTKKDVLDIYLAIGGIPEYLKKIKNASSLYLGLCENSFKPGGFFLKEKDRIFVSSLKENPNYEKIIAFLAKSRFATRDQILKQLNLKSGKNITEFLKELELSKLITSYVPYDSSESSLLRRYEIADPYLQFYFALIEPKLKAIEKGEYLQDTTKALNNAKLSQWLGYGLERFCRRFSFNLAKVLGFSSVEYDSGPFFNRNINKIEAGFQLDLVFKRADKVLTVCEIKHTKLPVSKKDAIEYLRKIELFKKYINNKYTIQNVLITTGGVMDEVKYGYWDMVLGVEDLF